MDIEQNRLEAWLAARRRHITSTDLASIMQLDDAYASPIDVFLDKQGLAERGPLPERQEWGHRLQHAILAGYADRTGQAIDEIDPYELFEVPGFPLLAASLDGRWSDGDRRCVDAKNIIFDAPSTTTRTEETPCPFPIPFSGTTRRPARPPIAARRAARGRAPACRAWRTSTPGAAAPPPCRTIRPGRPRPGAPRSPPPPPPRTPAHADDHPRHRDRHAAPRPAPPLRDTMAIGEPRRRDLPA